MLRHFRAILTALLVMSSGQLTGDDLSPHLAYKAAMQSAEQRILTALNRKIDVDFNNTPLPEALNSLLEGFPNVFIDRHSIDAELTVRPPGFPFGDRYRVTLEGKGLTVRSALNVILERIEASWMVRHDVLFITSKSASEDFLKPVVYGVSDLVPSAARNPAPPWCLGYSACGGHCPCPPVLPLDTQMDFFIEMLQVETSGPWEDIEGFGGFVSVIGTPKDNTPILVVRQSPRAQLEIQELLGDLRRVIHSEP